MLTFFYMLSDVVDLIFELFILFDILV